MQVVEARPQQVTELVEASDARGAALRELSERSFELVDRGEEAVAFDVQVETLYRMQARSAAQWKEVGPEGERRLGPLRRVEVR